MLCRSLFVPLLLAIMLSDSDYPFGVFKLFLQLHGGLGIFRKISIKDHIKILPSTFKGLFHLENDIYLYAAYIPPILN
jgi:hypothetical protein